MTSSTPFAELSPSRQKAIDGFLEELQHRTCGEIKNPDQEAGVEYWFRDEIADKNDVSVDTVTRTLRRDTDAIQARLNARDDLDYHGNDACHPEYVLDGVTRQHPDSESDEEDYEGELEWEPVGEQENTDSDEQATQDTLEDDFMSGEEDESGGGEPKSPPHATRRHTTEEDRSFEQVRRDLEHPGSAHTHDKAMKRVTALLVIGAVALAIAIGRIVRNNDNGDE